VHFIGLCYTIILKCTVQKQFKNVIFICPWIVIVIQNYSQQDATFFDLFIFTEALHVSGGSSAHHQEHITVHTASSIVNCNDRVK